MESWLETALELSARDGVDPNFMATYLSVIQPREKALAEKRTALTDSLAVKRLRIGFDVEDACYNLISLQRQLQVQEALLHSLQLKLEIEQRRLEQGLTSELATQAFELRVKESQLGLEKSRAAVQYATMRLNALLNRPVAQPLALQDILEYEPQQICLDESLSKALEPKYGELKNASLAYSDALENFKTEVTWGFAYGASTVHPEIAAMRLRQAEQASELSVRSKVNDVLNAEQAVILAQEALTFEQQKLSIEERKFDLGLTTQLLVADQANITATKEADVIQKIYQYKRAVLVLQLAEQGL